MLNTEQQAGTSGLPPSYESATYANGQFDNHYSQLKLTRLTASKYPVDIKQQPLPQPEPTSPMIAMHNTPVPATQAGAVTVYHYIHPTTQQRIDSLLPPSHPEMQCLQHGHIPRTRFGVAGILAAIFWFPLGLGCLLIDKDTRCERCKKVISGRLGSAP